MPIIEIETEYHSKFGYFKNNCCPFCYKTIRHSEEFFHHLNDVHKISETQDFDQGHYFCDSTLFIYKFEKSDGKCELNPTQSTNSISLDGNKFVMNLQDKDDYQGSYNFNVIQSHSSSRKTYVNIKLFMFCRYRNTRKLLFK